MIMNKDITQWLKDRLNTDNGRTHVGKRISLLLFIAYVVVNIVYLDFMNIGGGWPSFALFSVCVTPLVFPCHAPVLNGIGCCGLLLLEAMRSLIPALQFIPESFVGYLLICVCITMAAWGTSFGRQEASGSAS